MSLCSFPTTITIAPRAPPWLLERYNKCITAGGDFFEGDYSVLISFWIAQSAASLLRDKPPPNECPSYDTKQSDGEAPVILELWGMQSTPSLPSLPGPLWLEVVAPGRVLPMGQIELYCVLMLNGIAWNRTVLTFKLHIYVKLNCLKWNFFCMLNWIVWNRTVLIKIILILN